MPERLRSLYNISVGGGVWRIPDSSPYYKRVNVSFFQSYKLARYHIISEKVFKYNPIGISITPVISSFSIGIKKHFSSTVL